MDANGANVSQLNKNVDFIDRSPAWSPDGTKIVNVSTRDGNHELYTMNADGSDKKNVTNVSSNETEPTWSGNGQKIVFVTDRDGNAELYSMNPDGNAQTNISNNSAADMMPFGALLVP